ncbi:calcium permeable stress-gated cation channel 1 isoform X5 [Rhea pennata]|uniref:calcium permeable stress-gated cation channel 1 isoform X5 n=1 Tax=Rhea pennata TaxID=8795 RepID=UPI002E268F7F
MDSAYSVEPAPDGADSTSLDVLSFLDTLANSTEEQCFSAHSRSTVLQGLPFGGVPTVLAINFILWLLLLLIFSCLRKAAWDYGRLALLMDNDSLTSLFYGEQSEKEKSPSETSPLDTDNKDVGFCSWLISIYQMKDEEIQSKCGVDATTYLSFQRHLLVLLMLVCVLSVAVILPVNFSGDLLGSNPTHFGRTTIANIPTQDRLLWLHSIFSLIYFILTILCMAHHSVHLEYRENEKVARTLMVTQIPKEITDPSLIIKHFHEAYPSCTVTNVQFCFDVRKLMKLDAERILKDYSHIHCRKHPQQSSVTTVVKSHHWSVCYAPAPSDIIWENLSVRGTSWWVRFILLNICLFILLFFLTTPAIIVNTMDMFNVTRPVESLKNPIITQFFPTLLLWAFSVFLPFIVYYSAFFESHWTRSSENQLTMHKCFFFLVFMVIILPSLGLTSLDLFFRWLFDMHFLDEADIKFQCVFLPDNGAFFVNYIITSSLIGTAMELLRIPGLLVYATRLCFAKSEPERLHIKRSQAYQFQFGLEYAWTCCIFSVIMTYSITCPIIVPFGLLYMLLKHMVDRYNIYYVYIPTKLNQRLHVAAISQVVVAPIFCMFWLLFFSVLRLGPTRPVTLFTFVVLLSCIIFSFFGLCLKKLQPRKPSSYQMSNQSDSTFNDTERSSVSSTPNSNLFMATVLQEPELSLTPAASPAHQSYGTMGNHLEPADDREEGGLQSFETELEAVEGEYRTGPVMESQARYQ